MGEKRPEPARPPSKKAETDRLDEALKATFPASDPVAIEPVDGPLPKHAPPKHGKS
ncbi:MAG TPA: hypothetical protein VGI89_01825 [Rhizomicrobium sp.]